MDHSAGRMPNSGRTTRTADIGKVARVRIPLISVVVAGALLLGACGDDSDSATTDPVEEPGGTVSDRADDQSDDPTALDADDDAGPGVLEPVSSAYSEAFAAEMKATGPADMARAECVAQRLVAAVGGPEAIEAAGLTPEQFRDMSSFAEAGLPATDDTVVRVVRAFTDCETTAFEFIARLAGFTDAQIECMKDAPDVDVDAGSELIARGMVQGEDATGGSPDAVRAAAEACGSEDG